MQKKRFGKILILFSFKPPLDEVVLSRVKQQMLDYVRQQKKNGSYFFLETAGGIHSPVMSGKIGTRKKKNGGEKN